jgi:hypothetical protein
MPRGCRPLPIVRMGTVYKRSLNGASAYSSVTKPVAVQTWQRPFRVVRLARDAGSGQSESGLLWYWPLAGILGGLMYSGVAVWRYRPMERAIQPEPPVLNESRPSRGPIATEPSVELGL